MKFFICILFLLPAAGIRAQSDNYGDKDSYKALLSDFYSDDAGKRTASEAWIKRTRPVTVAEKFSESLLTEKSEAVRNRSLEGLKLFPPSSEVSALLINLLYKSESFVVQTAVIEHMAEFNNRNFVIPFAQKLSSPFTAVRSSAAHALKKYADDRVYPFVLDLAESSDPVKKIYSLEALAHLYDRRFQPLLTDLLKDGNGSVRSFAIKCVVMNNLTILLGQVRDMALNDSLKDVRLAAIAAMGEMKDTGGIYQLGRLVSDPDRDIRLEAVNAVYKTGSYNAIHYLATRLTEETDEEIAAGILNCFILFKRSGDLRGLERVLVSEMDFRLRIKAAYVLGIIRDERAVPVLAKGLEDRDFRVRAESAASLGSYRSRAALNSLLETVKRDRVRYVRSAALYSIKNINDRSALAELFEIFSVEKEPVFRLILKDVIAGMIKKYT